MDTCDNKVLLPSMIVTAPVWIPVVAGYGIFQGIKAAVKGVQHVTALHKGK